MDLGLHPRFDLRAKQRPVMGAGKQQIVEQETGRGIHAERSGIGGHLAQPFGHWLIGKAAINTGPVISARGHNIIEFEIAGYGPAARYPTASGPAGYLGLGRLGQRADPGGLAAHHCGVV